MRIPAAIWQFLKGLAKKLEKTVPEVLVAIIDQFIQGGNPELRAIAAEARTQQEERRSRAYERALGKRDDELRELRKRFKEQAYALRTAKDRLRRHVAPEILRQINKNAENADVLERQDVQDDVDVDVDTMVLRLKNAEIRRNPP